MKKLPDGSCTFDKWDKRAAFLVMKKFGTNHLKTDIDEINIVREYITKNVFRKIYYTLKYRVPRFGKTLYSISSIKNGDDFV